MDDVYAPRAGTGCSAPDPVPARQQESSDDPGQGVLTTFQSIVYPRVMPGMRTEETAEPDFARDLNLDQIVAAVTAGYDEYNLKPFFYRRLDDPDQITYRHEVMRDLENREVKQRAKAFLADMRTVRDTLTAAGKMYYVLQKHRRLVEAVELYVAAASRLAGDLAALPLASRGLVAFSRYMSAYVAAAAFRELVADTARLTAGLAAVRYCVLVHGDAVTVRDYAGETDYSEEVGETFARFRQDAARDYLVRFHGDANMNHIEAQILGLVARLNPEVFGFLAAFATRHRDFLDPVIGRFVREIHFYISYLEHIAAIRSAGLAFCYPEVSAAARRVFGRDVFDLALAAKLVPQGVPVVTNDFALAGDERIFVVSGANQGGKTTFVRTFGQLHHLASLGCPVPGSSAQLFLFDCIFTHFEREERIGNLRGKLQDDLLRIRDILDRITPNSIVLMNEIFSSTTLDDAVFLATKVMQKIIDTDCLCVCVTFMDELTALHRKMVSMVSTVVAEEPSRRTLKIVRRPADGRSYAISIAEKYRLTDEWLRRRLAP
jgi:DNA mismatch repair protein MutS